MRTEYYFVASYVNIKLQTHSTNTPWWQSTVQHITSFIFAEEREVLSSQRLSVCLCVYKVVCLCAYVVVCLCVYTVVCLCVYVVVCLCSCVFTQLCVCVFM